MEKKAEWHKWMVFASSLYVTTFVFGFLFAFASIINELLDTFGENRSVTVTVQAILLGVALSPGVFSGILTDRFGVCKASATGAILCPLGLILAFFAESIVQLDICIGCITGFGISLQFISATTAVTRSFSGSQRLLVLAISQSFACVAGVALPYLFNFLIDKYGLKGTLLVLGGMFFNSIPVARLFAIFCEKNTKLETYLNDIESTGREDYNSLISFFATLKQELTTLKRNIIKIMSVPYVLHFIAVGIMVSSVNAYMSLVLDILQWKGLSESDALLAFPVAYGVGFGARLLPGLVKQCNGVNSLALPIIFGLCGCTGQIMIYVFSNQLVVLVGCGLSGIAVSGVISSAGIVVVQIVGQENMAIGYGLVITAVGILSAALGPTYGAIRDSSDSYGSVLLLTSGLQLVGTVLLILTVIVRRHTRRKTTYLEKINEVTENESQTQLIYSISQKSPNVASRQADFYLNNPPNGVDLDILNTGLVP